MSDKACDSPAETKGMVGGDEAPGRLEAEVRGRPEPSVRPPIHLSEQWESSSLCICLDLLEI